MARQKCGYILSPGDHECKSHEAQESEVKGWECILLSPLSGRDAFQLYMSCECVTPLPMALHEQAAPDSLCPAQFVVVR